MNKLVCIFATSILSLTPSNIVFARSPSSDDLGRRSVASAASEAKVSGRYSAAQNLMPKPVSVEASSDALPILGGVKLVYAGFTDKQIQKAGERFLLSLRKRTGLMPDDSLSSSTITIECAASDQANGSMKANENYSLAVDSKGVLLKAGGQTGVIRGLATLVQLVEYGPKGFQFAAARIDDHPRYPWRGLLLDPARHFVSVDTLKRQIDAMEAVKMNVLHLHLSDHEAFRMESKAFPKLQETANGEFYTQAEMKDLIAYAADRAVRILPEFDMPGHSGSEVKAYPELGTPTGKEPDGIIDPSRESTYTFLEAFLDEMSNLFPDAYYHMGGDEVGGESWMANSSIKKFMRQKGFKDKVELQAYFTNRVKKMLDDRGKIMIGWDEILNPKLQGDVMVQSWRSFDMTAKTAQGGYPVLVSNGYYLDMLTPADVHYLVDPTEKTGIEQAVVDGAKKEKIVLTEEQKSKFLGGEACMWGEIASDEMIDSRNWPRTAAVAERFWSPSSVKDVGDMYRRLIVIDNLLAILGLQQHANIDRMTARLAPSRTSVLAKFLTAVRPSPNWGHFKPLQSNWKITKPIQQFNELADIAPPDSLAAKQLELDIKSYLKGAAKDDALRATIESQFISWRDNHVEFEKIAQDNAIMSSALPRSKDVQELSGYALNLLESIQKGSKPSEELLAKCKTLLARQDLYDEATKDFGAVSSTKQPPADLILVLQPAVRLLMNAANEQLR